MKASNSFALQEGIAELADLPAVAGHPEATDPTDCLYYRADYGIRTAVTIRYGALLDPVGSEDVFVDSDPVCFL